jgi:hypothetical protein
MKGAHRGNLRVDRSMLGRSFHCYQLRERKPVVSCHFLKVIFNCSQVGLLILLGVQRQQGWGCLPTGLIRLQRHRHIRLNRAAMQIPFPNARNAPATNEWLYITPVKLEAKSAGQPGSRCVLC